MIVIPAIDIMDGKCVRLTRGDFDSRVTYHADPLEQAKIFEANGFRYLHLVDLDGAKKGKLVNYPILEKIAGNTTLEIDFGGGIKTTEDIVLAFSCGASQLCIGSVAALKPSTFLSWIETYGVEKFILSADVLHRKIHSNGWQEGSETDVIDFIKYFNTHGVNQAMCTDISKDGMLQGPSLNLYKEILDSIPIQLIASGGISTLQDIEDLHNMGCYAAVVGKAIYENRISLSQLSAYA